MADVITGVTQLANWLDTVFTPAAFGYFQHKRTLSNYMTDYSYLLAPGAKAVVIPQSALVTATTRGAGAETVIEYTGATESLATITVNQFYTAAHLITDAAQLQTSTQLQEHYITATAYALISAFETYMAGTVLQGATTNDVSIATTDNNLTWDYVVSAISKLQVYNAYEPGMMALGCSPEAWALGVKDWGAKYTSIETMRENFGTNGALGQLAGIPIYVSDDWDGDGTTGDETATLWNKKAVGYAMQNMFKVIGPTPDPLRGGTGFSVELYFGGVKVIETGIANFNNP